MELKINSKTYGEKIVLIDADDLKKISNYKWHISYKKKRNVFIVQSDIIDNNKKRKTLLLHRLITDCIPGYDVDHINGNTLDNRQSNLRICNRSENLMNQKKRINSNSKYKGVYFHKRDKKWISQITLNKKHIHLGYFKDEKQAAIKYNEYAIKYFGEFARLNII